MASDASSNSSVEPELADHPLGHAELALAPVDQQEVGPVGEAAGSLGRLLERGEPPGQDLLHGGVVVVALHRLDLEAAVVGPLGQPVLEHHHGAHVVGPLQVAHVEALDTQRGLAQAERRLELGQGLGAGVVVGRPAQAVTGQVLGGRPGHRLLQGALGAPAGARPRRPGRRARCAASLAGGRGRRGSSGTRTRRGTSAADRAVDLGHDQAHELGRAEVLHLLGHEAAVADHPAPADVEDLHRGLERVVGDTDHVEVLGPLGDHLLGLGRLLRHGDAVAQAGRPLELQVLGRCQHLGLQPGQHRLGVTGEEPHQVLDVAVVGGVVDRADARARAALDVDRAGRAGPAARGG